MNRLLIIDGNAVLHRAYHAIPPLTSPDGTVVNAVYGFTSMLLRLIGDLTPTHVTVCFDRPKPTFRKELYKEYQAKRPKMEDELAGQIDTVHQVIQAMKVSIFEVDGFEADDVIGTICKKISNVHFPASNKKQENQNTSIDQIIIVTGDRDILQLIEDEHVLVYMPTKGLSEAKLYGEKETVERMGVTPKKIPDYKALAGDSSDNYPGVAGIGPKTAIALLTTFGSVEAVFDALKMNDTKLRDFSSSVIEKLKNGEESAMMSHDLATIRTNAPIEVESETLLLGNTNTDKAREIFTTLGFRTLLKRLEGGKSEPEKKHMKREEKEDKGEQLSLV